MFRRVGDTLLEDRPGIRAFIEQQVDDAQVGPEAKAFCKYLPVSYRSK
jgi:hypothetical protein